MFLLYCKEKKRQDEISHDNLFINNSTNSDLGPLVAALYNFSFTDCAGISAHSWTRAPSTWRSVECFRRTAGSFSQLLEQNGSQRISAKTLKQFRLYR